MYSSVCLKDVLPRNHYQCWLLYVRACKILLSPSILKQSVSASDQYLVQFCKMFETLCGAEQCTIKVLDYGPVYSFWCFSFERFNGILGSYFTNNHSIEVQFMKKFLLQQHCLSIHLPDEFEELLTLCKEKKQLCLSFTHLCWW